MFCPKCGTQNPEIGKFCRSCGTDLGNVSAALSGNLKPAAPQPLTDARDKDKQLTWEGAYGKLFMGFAFLIISLVLWYTGMGTGWWFWLLIPAFGMLGTGMAQCGQLQKLEESQKISSHSQAAQNEIAAAPPTVALPPMQTDYVKPQQKSIYDTGEFYEKPPSVTEGTTRHLEINNEGETMTLPKK